MWTPEVEVLYENQQGLKHAHTGRLGTGAISAAYTFSTPLPLSCPNASQQLLFLGASLHLRPPFTLFPSSLHRLGGPWGARFCLERHRSLPRRCHGSSSPCSSSSRVGRGVKGLQRGTGSLLYTQLWGGVIHVLLIKIHGREDFCLHLLGASTPSSSS